MARKNDDYQSALADLKTAHRTAEDGRLAALQQLESRSYEIDDHKASLDSAIERLNHLQNEYMRAEAERDALREALRRLQSGVTRAINANRPLNVDGDPTAPDEEALRSQPFPSADDPNAADFESTLAKLISRVERLQRVSSKSSRFLRLQAERSRQS